VRGCCAIWRSRAPGRAYLRAIATGEVDYDFEALAEIHAGRGAHLER